MGICSNNDDKNNISEYKNFDQITPKLSKGTLDFVKNELKFKFMSPVQENTIPELLTYKDVAVEACTGSGKTMSYLIPVVEILLKTQIQSEKISNFNIGSLIITPTRELSMQVYSILELYLNKVRTYKCSNLLRSIVCIGGDHVKKTLELIKEEDKVYNDFKCCYHILVGTPGRIFHLCEELKDGIDWNIKSTFEILILDEADRLLDMGFEKQIQMILRFLPKQRRTGLFSATLTTQVENLIKTGLRNPKYIKVSIDSNINDDKEIESNISVPLGLTCYYIELSPLQKIEFLIQFLLKMKKDIDSGKKIKCIIFFLTCNSVEFYFKYISNIFHKHLNSNNIKDLEYKKNDYFVESYIGDVCKLHGQMYQRSREKSYEIFKNCSNGVLISTDLAARGIDIPDIEWILQFDAPQDPSYYIHRIGRTARAGKFGKSLIILQPHEGAFIEYIENKTKKKIINYENFIETEGIKIEYENNSDCISLCSCIKMNQELLNKDEFLNDKLNNNKIGLTTMRRLILSDSEFYEKAKKSFVSYIRAYKEYHLSFIFPFKNLSIGEIASSFALLRIPRIKEILGKSGISSHFITGSKTIHPDDLNPEFKLNKERELINKNKNKFDNDKNINSLNQKNKDKTISISRSRSEKRATKRRIEIDEWNSLQFEDNLAKKLKKGKITYKEYLNKLRKFNQEENGNDDIQDQLSDFEISDIETNNNKKINNSKYKIPKWVLQRKKNKKKR